jgi:hypothetical protein
MKASLFGMKLPLPDAAGLFSNISERFFANRHAAPDIIIRFKKSILIFSPAA